RPSRGPWPHGENARTDVGRRALASQAPRRTRTHAPRPPRPPADYTQPTQVRDHMPALAHRLDRTIVINAPREAVFRYFTDSAHWAMWWGAGSTIDARPGGKMYIKYPEGTEVAGEVLEVKPPERIVFTYGYMKGEPFPAGGSRVTIQLAGDRGATRLTLTHELADASARDQHIQGWRYQLSV